MLINVYVRSTKCYIIGNLRPTNTTRPLVLEPILLEFIYKNIEGALIH